MKDRVSILTSDAMVDPRFGAGDSIRFHGIRSAMCAPLWNKDEVIGIIHVDSPDAHQLLHAERPRPADRARQLRGGGGGARAPQPEDRGGGEEAGAAGPLPVAAGGEPHPGHLRLQGAALGVPEVREVTVLFADIIGFTSMSETMSPAAVALLLNDYLSRMTDVIFKYEGTLDKYIGDAIMAVFGAPLDMPDHAARAIKAALEMQERLDEWNADRKEGPRHPDPHRDQQRQRDGGRDRQHQQEGVHGARRHREHRQPAGELGGQAGHGRDRREHLRAVEGRFDSGASGSVTLKGKEKEVAVYEVRAAGSPPARRLPAARGRPRSDGGPCPGAREGWRLSARAAAAASSISLLALLFAVGVVPLLWTSYKLVSRSREILELDQKTSQLDKARSLSQQVAVYLGSLQPQITAIARTLEVDTAPGQFAARVARIRESRTLERFMRGRQPLRTP